MNSLITFAVTEAIQSNSSVVLKIMLWRFEIQVTNGMVEDMEDAAGFNVIKMEYKTLGIYAYVDNFGT